MKQASRNPREMKFETYLRNQARSNSRTAKWRAGKRLIDAGAARTYLGFGLRLHFQWRIALEFGLGNMADDIDGNG
jgi:hypothetical protein